MIDFPAGPVSNFWPAVLLALGFPLTLLLLNELIAALRGGGNPLVRSLVTLRNLVAPALALLIFVLRVLELPRDDPAVRVIATVFWLLLLYALLGAVNDLVFRLSGAGTWRQRVPELFLDLVRAALVAVGAIIIYSQVWGGEITGALTALGLGSVVIGLALQEPVGNIVSGLMLLFERPITVGDWIETNKIKGRIIEINWRAVHIETATRELYIVPNVSLYKSAFSNLSRPTPLRTEQIELGFSYDDPPNRVKAVMLDLLMTTSDVLHDPPPRVRTLSYDDAAITYRLVFSVTRQDQVSAVRDAIMTRLWYVVRRAGLTIPYTVDQPGRAPLTPAQWLAADHARFLPAVSAGADRETPIMDYAKGEDVQHLGTRFQGFALILEGRAALLAGDAQGRAVVIGELGPGECFGSQLTAGGASDDLGIRAVEDVKLMVFDSHAVSDLLNRSPALATEIGDAIEARRRAAQAARLHGSDSADRRPR
jgi:small-conductance mechanosensitive channel